MRDQRATIDVAGFDANDCAKGKDSLFWTACIAGHAHMARYLAIEAGADTWAKESSRVCRCGPAHAPLPAGDDACTCHNPKEYKHGKLSWSDLMLKTGGSNSTLRNFADNVCTGWDIAIEVGRVPVYDLLAKLAESGHEELQVQFKR